MASLKLETPALETGITVPQTELRDGCCHHWMIESPGGPVSSGVCRFCGGRKHFNNSVPMREYHKRNDKAAEGVADVKTLPPLMGNFAEAVLS